MYTQDKFVRQFLVSWVSLLDSVPDSEMVKHLPEFLDPLFDILDDSSPEISTLCDNILGEFLEHITAKPEVVDFPAMINILISHSLPAETGHNIQLQVVSISWIREFVSLAGPAMLPYTSGTNH